MPPSSRSSSTRLTSNLDIMSLTCDSRCTQGNASEDVHESAVRRPGVHARVRGRHGVVRHRGPGVDQPRWRCRPTDQDARRSGAGYSGDIRAVRLLEVRVAHGRARTADPTRSSCLRVRSRGNADLRVWLSRERGLSAAQLHLGVPVDDRALEHRRRDRVLPLPMKNRLRVLRAERDWSQGELADRLEVSRQTVNALENEKYDPSLPLAFRIAALFGTRIEDIFRPE